MMLMAVYCVAGAFAICFSMAVAFSPTYWTRWLTGIVLAWAVFFLFLTATTPGLYYNYDGYLADLWTAAEALNKANGGLISSIDFFSPIGPAYYWALALTADLSEQVSAATIMHASALTAAVITALGMIMLWGTLSGTGLAVIVFSIIAVAVSGRGNGEILKDMPMHYLAPYNRWCWALFIPVMAKMSLPDRGRNILVDIALGVAIALLLLTKITYGAAAIGMLGTRIVLMPSTWRQGTVAVSALIATLGLVQIMTGQVTAHLQDIIITAQLPQSGIRLQKLFSQLGEMVLYITLACVVYLSSHQNGPDRPYSTRNIYVFIRPLLLITLVALASCTVLMQNHYSVEAATYPVLLLIALEWTGGLNTVTLAVGWNKVRQRVLLTLTLGFILFYPIVDLGMHVGQRIQLARYDPDSGFSDTAYADLLFEPYHATLPTSLISTLADGRSGVLAGLDTLRLAGADQDGVGTVAALSFANPFPILLGKPSPSGTPIWLHEGRSFSEEIFVDPEVFFEGVDFVMIPADDGGVLRRIYADILQRDFVRSSEDPFWILLERSK